MRPSAIGRSQRQGTLRLRVPHAAELLTPPADMSFIAASRAAIGARRPPALRLIGDWRRMSGSALDDQAGAPRVATSALISAPTRATASFPASMRFTNEKKSWNMSS
jgi:hypothetical protein